MKIYNPILTMLKIILSKPTIMALLSTQRKFVFGVQHVDFCGYEVNKNSLVVNEVKALAITAFPYPTNFTYLRSFMGLVNQ